MRPLDALLAELRRSDIRLWIEGERLRYSAPTGQLSAALLDEMRQRKAELIEFLRAAKRAAHAAEAAIRPTERGDTVPVSFAQQRLWFLDQLEGASATYSMPTALQLEGRLDIAILERSLNEIVRRHEILRTTCPSEHVVPIQYISALQSLMLPVSDMQAQPGSDLQQLIDAEATRPFDLATGPLLRVTLIRRSAHTHVLLINMHHIIAD